MLLLLGIAAANSEGIFRYVPIAVMVPIAFWFSGKLFEYRLDTDKITIIFCTMLPIWSVRYSNIVKTNLVDHMLWARPMFSKTFRNTYVGPYIELELEHVFYKTIFIDPPDRKKFLSELDLHSRASGKVK